MTTTELRPLDADGMRIAAAGVAPLPIEQSAVWEPFEVSQGRPCWGRFEWFEDDKRIALLCLYEYNLHGARYLWARHGPVWLREQSPAREVALRANLRKLVRRIDPGIVFVRLHAAYRATDLTELLQAITYDRTVIIDTSGGNEDSVLASMTTDGRRAVRRAMKRMSAGDAEVVEETGLTREALAEYYDVLEETAARDGFRPHPMSVYWDLLTSLGPDHARLFGVRVGKDRELACWDLVLANDRQATAYYGASRTSARAVLGPDALDFSIAVILASEGFRGFDLMGAHSARVPELYSVGRYKRRFARSYTDVDGAWDMPIRWALYRGLVMSLRAKHAAVRLRTKRAESSGSHD